MTTIVRTERVLVAAPYPTMPGPEARATLDFVRALTADGHDVYVVSPRPSAAHAHADPGGPRGAVKLASLVAGRDRIVLRLDAAAVGADRDAPALLPGRLALAAALRRAGGRLELILDRVPESLSPRWVSLVLKPATAVTVGTEAERDALVRAGVATSAITVAPTPRAETAAREHRDAAAPEHADAATIEELIRRRAAEFAPATEAGPEERSPASRPLRHLVPLERPEVRTRKPGAAVVKRVQLRLLGWMFDAVIQHVNRLHRATIEAIELSEQPRR